MSTLLYHINQAISASISLYTHWATVYYFKTSGPSLLAYPPPPPNESSHYLICIKILVMIIRGGGNFFSNENHKPYTFYVYK